MICLTKDLQKLKNITESDENQEELEEDQREKEEEIQGELEEELEEIQGELEEEKDEIVEKKVENQVEKKEESKEEEYSYNFCNWKTENKVCQNSVVCLGQKFCNRHTHVIKNFKLIPIKNRNDFLCSTTLITKFIPRSKKHIINMMKNLGLDEVNINVYIIGSATSIEEAYYETDEYIELAVDSTKYYYVPKRGQLNAKNLKVILESSCLNMPIVKVQGNPYCKECYNKNAIRYNYPIIDLIKEEK